MPGFVRGTWPRDATEGLSCIVRKDEEVDRDV
jgi:hypothetical protein